ncbi:hypothetical protein [Janthinobacterium sp.]|uniref:hypothetical protein n=1 Tax=Janthinobacterium sp. TaxID=1871054 RepID=UPI002613876E|nr:hypothetical protein [Janthinobacterium sp.]
MFVLIEDKSEVKKAQKKLESSFRRDFTRKTVKNIGYPGGTTFDAHIHTDGRYWYWSTDHKEAGVANPRRLNWFGIFNEDKDLQISVEINTTYEGRNDQVAGFFARDSETGAIYLMHSGRVGGGTKGVSKTALLAWSNQPLIDVLDASGRVREGVLVMPVEGSATSRSAIRYIDTIAQFKQAVRDGAINTPEFKQKHMQFEEFYAEARGRRKGRRSGTFDYISRHGDVVDALAMWRKERSMPRNSRLVKNVLIDMGVSVGKNLVEVFEVKTSTSRTDVYGAIGQVMVHGTNDRCRRVVVLPKKERISEDLLKALLRLNIELLKFEIDEKTANVTVIECEKV